MPSTFESSVQRQQWLVSHKRVSGPAATGEGGWGHFPWGVAGRWSWLLRAGCLLHVQPRTAAWHWEMGFGEDEHKLHWKVVRGYGSWASQGVVNT